MKNLFFSLVTLVILGPSIASALITEDGLYIGVYPKPAKGICSVSLSGAQTQFSLMFFGSVLKSVTVQSSLTNGEEVSLECNDAKIDGPKLNCQGETSDGIKVILVPSQSKSWYEGEEFIHGPTLKVYGDGYPEAKATTICDLLEQN